MICRFLIVLAMTTAALAQSPAPPPGNPGARHEGGPRPRIGMAISREGPGMAGIPGGTWWRNTELAQKIGLTDDQTKQMEQIYQQSRLELIDKVAAVQKQEAQLDPLIQSDNPNESLVLAQIDKVAQARAELEKSHARMLLGIRRLLSADQWNKLKAEVGQHRHFEGGDNMRRRAPEGGDNMRRREGPPPPGDQLE